MLARFALFCVVHDGLEFDKITFWSNHDEMAFKVAMGVVWFWMDIGMVEGVGG